MAKEQAQLEIRQSNEIIDQIVNSSNNINTATADLDTNIVNENLITLKEGTILPPASVRKFKAGETIIIGGVIYNKGDELPGDTELPTNATVIEEEFSDVSEATDIETGVTTVLPDDDEVNVGTTDTTSGMSRTIDNYLDQKYGDMTEWTFGYGEFKSRQGDDLVCLGNLFTDNRQNAIVISSTDPIDPELTAPAIGQYNHIDKFGESISKYRMTAIAANGNEFIGSFLVSYDGKYFDVNQRIEMFATDIKTGLEKVGIHLDGNDSTITMIGSVKLMQHDSNTVDTLSIYDALGTRRVELTPADIPSRENAKSGINIVDSQIPTVVFTKTASSDYISITRNKNWHNPFTYYYTYNYYLKNFGISVSSSVNLGYLEANTSLDLSQLWLHISVPQYLPSGDKLTDHTYYLDPQSISSIKYTLKKNGVSVTGYRNVELINNPGISISGLTTDVFDVSLNSTFLNDLPLTAAGTYSIQFTVNAILQGHRPDYGTKYSNPYIYVIGSLVGGVTSSTQPLTNISPDQSARKLTIGTNGMSFTGNNSRFFYAATDGYEMHWDDNWVKLGSDVGLQLNKTSQSINNTFTCTQNIDMLICAFKSGGYTVTLQDASLYGQAREMKVVGFDNLKLKCKTGNKIWYNGSELDDITFSSTTAPNKVMTLVAVNQFWYVF